MTSTDAARATQPALIVTRQDHVALVTLNRPGRINAINDEIRDGLPEILGVLDDDPSVRAIVLHGGTARGFCVGADITEARGPETAVTVRRRNTQAHWVDGITGTSKPLIAAIHGFCLGGGLEIALACDIRMATQDAQFGLPETGLGLIPGAGGTQLLPRLVGLGRALDMMLTGDRVNAAEAHRIGLVTRLVADGGDLLAEAMALAGRIAERPPSASQYVKEAAYAAVDLPLQAGMQLERSLFALLSATEDRAEAARAFKEKRKPQFDGT